MRELGAEARLVEIQHEEAMVRKQVPPAQPHALCREAMRPWQRRGRSKGALREANSRRMKAFWVVRKVAGSGEQLVDQFGFGRASLPRELSAPPRFSSFGISAQIAVAS
jgi:hypothetical protein